MLRTKITHTGTGKLGVGELVSIVETFAALIFLMFHACTHRMSVLEAFFLGGCVSMTLLSFESICTSLDDS